MKNREERGKKRGGMLKARQIAESCRGHIGQIKKNQDRNIDKPKWIGRGSRTDFRPAIGSAPCMHA